jgi:hypothetical protein
MLPMGQEGNIVTGEKLPLFISRYLFVFFLSSRVPSEELFTSPARKPEISNLSRA